MKSFEAFQHLNTNVNVDDSMLQTQTALCGLIQEMAEIGRGVTTEHALVMLCNKMAHDLPNKFTKIGENSTFGSKQMFVEQVLNELKIVVDAQQQQVQTSENVKLKHTIKLDDFNVQATDMEGVDQHIVLLQTKIKEYLDNVTIQLIDKKVTAAADRFAEAVNASPQMSDNKKQTDEDINQHAAAIVAAGAALRQALSISDDSDIQNNLTAKVKRIIDQKVPRYSAQPASTAEELIESIEHIEGQEVTAIEGNLSAAREAVEKAEKKRLEEVTANLRKLMEAADKVDVTISGVHEQGKTDNIQHIQDMIEELNKLMPNLTSESYTIIREMLLAESTTDTKNSFKNILQAVGYTITGENILLEGTPKYMSAVHFAGPADIRAGLATHLENMSATSKLMIGELTRAGGLFEQVLNGSEDTGFVNAINHIPHSISAILDSLKTSSTYGASSFF